GQASSGSLEAGCEKAKEAGTKGRSSSRLEVFLKARSITSRCQSSSQINAPCVSTILNQVPQ
ncbi:hypothetical protein DL98DRAFT_443468, partial [Cadophora sp. DSE1049]